MQRFSLNKTKGSGQIDPRLSKVMTTATMVRAGGGFYAPVYPWTQPPVSPHNPTQRQVSFVFPGYDDDVDEKHSTVNPIMVETPRAETPTPLLTARPTNQSLGPKPVIKQPLNNPSLPSLPPAPQAPQAPPVPLTLGENMGSQQSVLTPAFSRRPVPIAPSQQPAFSYQRPAPVPVPIPLNGQQNLRPTRQQP